MALRIGDKMDSEIDGQEPTHRKERKQVFGKSEPRFVLCGLPVRISFLQSFQRSPGRRRATTGVSAAAVGAVLNKAPPPPRGVSLRRLSLRRKGFQAAGQAGWAGSPPPPWVQKSSPFTLTVRWNSHPFVINQFTQFTTNLHNLKSIPGAVFRPVTC